MFVKGCISDVGRGHFCWHSKRDPKPTEPARPSLLCLVHPVKIILNAEQAKPHDTRPLSVIGWNTIYFGFEWLVVPLFLCMIWEHRLPTEKRSFDGLLMGRAASES